MGSTMLSFILATTLVLRPVQACIAGFQYVPPAGSAGSAACLPCSRGAPSSRLLFSPAAPCCADTTTTTNSLTNATGCGVSNTRIVGGQDATENQFPWQCAILNSDNTFYGCGATIISCDPVIIVSAAHCFEGNNALPGGKKVSCGAHMMGGVLTSPAPLDTNEERLTITEIRNHPDYDDTTFNNDIAVIKVSGSFSCSPDKIWPTCLPSSERYTYVGWEDTIVSGWGTLSSGGALSDILQWVKVPPVSDATCNQPDSYNGQITANMICVGQTSGGKDACQGDSGGPLVSRATGVDSGYSLIGVVMTYNCGLQPKPTVHTEVSHFLPWIAEQYGLELP